MANAAKQYFAMARGLNTEAPLINFPDGYTTEEQNYELTVQGARRRRPGLVLETGGVTIELPEYTDGDVIKAHDWENVGGIATTNFIVVQIGYSLHIFDDTNPISPTRKSFVIDIRSTRVPEATDTQIAQHPLESAFGRGHLFFFGKYTTPFYIEYDPDTDEFDTFQIRLRERDFKGVDDGVPDTLGPATISVDHRYNLKNRGWTDALINAYYSDQSKGPSKNMIPWLGLKRALTGADSYDTDGIRSFVPAKLASEFFQDASAPQGHFIINPFETESSDDGTTTVPLQSGWSMSPASPTAGQTVTLTLSTDDPHGLSDLDEVVISDLQASFLHDVIDFVYYVYWLNVDGTYEVYDTTTNGFKIDVTWPPYDFQSWWNQYSNTGTVTLEPGDPSGNVVDFRPKAGAFFAGRVWYAGVDTARLTGRIYFSQVIESDAQYAKCYQIADPTDERISDLVPSDGGVIVIPEASNVIKLLPFNSSLLVFASNGVWEIGPGDLGYFAATSYSVRKVSDSGAVSSGSVVLLDNLPVYWGVTDIYGIVPNPQTGFLEVTNLSQTVINTFYNNIPLSCKRNSVGVYDDLNKRIVWVYSSSEDNTINANDRALIFDARNQAFIPFVFAYTATDYIASICVLKEAGEVSKIKYLGVIGGELVFGEAANTTDYTDFDIAEPECYLVTGYDSLREPSNFKIAPYVWVFSRKTETGYDDSLNPIRPSSTFMQSRWEWADDVSAGKWGREQQVYRHSRTYVPEDSSDTFDDGTPVVVTRNKLRGRGRVLQLKFRAGEGQDSYILGWKTNFTRLE